MKLKAMLPVRPASLAAMRCLHPAAARGHAARRPASASACFQVRNSMFLRWAGRTNGQNDGQAMLAGENST